jgi:uncharacterized protein (DUF2147 family)
MMQKMKKNSDIIWILCFFPILALFFTTAQAEKVMPQQEKNLSPVGLWRTLDDKTKKTSGFIRIWIDNGELKGRIEGSIKKPGESTTDRCTKCTGSRHNQLILGMTIIYGMHGSGQVWKNGYVLDPRNGNIYRANVTVSDDGKELYLRGYLGISLLGKTATWYRAE